MGILGYWYLLLLKVVILIILFYFVEVFWRVFWLGILGIGGCIFVRWLICDCGILVGNWMRLGCFLWVVKVVFEKFVWRWGLGSIGVLFGYG